MPAQAVTYDLSADWSDTVNPNGAWQYGVAGQLAICATRSWDSFSSPGAPPIWTAAGYPTYLGWSKENGSLSTRYDLQPGDIYGHTGGGVIQVNWVSPSDGETSIAGAVWHIRDIGRVDRWVLTLNGSLEPLAWGATASGDGHGRSNPWVFNLTQISIQAGDVLAFCAFSPPGPSPLGPYIDPDYLALKLRIVTSAIGGGGGGPTPNVADSESTLLLLSLAALPAFMVPVHRQRAHRA